MPPTIVTIANEKGGCGKTTTTINVAGGLTKAKYRVKVVDVDPQASATIWSLAQGQDGLPFDVLPSRQLARGFQSIAGLDCDIVLIDLPPGFISRQDDSSRFAHAAITGSDAVLVPLRPSPADFAASRQLVRFLVKTKPADVKLAVLINGKKPNGLGREARDQVLSDFAPIPGTTVFESTIGDRTAIVEVSGSGKTIFDSQPKHKAAFEYAALTKEIIQWLTKNPF